MNSIDAESLNRFEQKLTQTLSLEDELVTFSGYRFKVTEPFAGGGIHDTDRRSTVEDRLVLITYLLNGYRERER